MDISKESVEIIKETDLESDLVDELDKESKNTIGANNKLEPSFTLHLQS